MNLRYLLLQHARAIIASDTGTPYICHAITRAADHVHTSLGYPWSEVYPIANNLRFEIQRCLGDNASINVWVLEQLQLLDFEPRTYPECLPEPYRSFYLHTDAARMCRLAWLDRLMEDMKHAD